MGQLALVTGGAGFIGSNLAEALLLHGWTVRILDDLSTGHRSNLSTIEEDVELVVGSVNDPASLSLALRGVSVVFHQAAIPSVPRSVKDPLASHHANATGTLNLLTAAREQGVERVVYASSSSVYGPDQQLPLREGMAPGPMSPYAVSKLAGEHYCRAFWRTFRLPTVSLRYFNVFGPRQDPNSEYAAVVPRFATSILGGSPVTIHGDGNQSRDFTFIGNVVAANLCAAQAGGEAFGRAFNIATGERHSLRELLATLVRLTCAPEPRINWTESRAGDITASQADISAARQVLGYAPTIGFSAGLGETLNWLKEADPKPGLSAASA